MDSWGYWLGIGYASSSTIAPIAIPAWFLPSLFVSMLVSYFIIKASQKIPGGGVKFIFVIALILVIFGILNIQMFWSQSELNLVMSSHIANKNLIALGLPWNLDIVPITSAMVIFGWLFKYQIQKICFNWVHFIIALIIFGTLHIYFHYYIDFAARRFYDVLICLSQVIIGIYIVSAFSSKIQLVPIFSRVLVYLGQVSLIILLFHMPIRNATARILSHTNISFGLSSILASVICLLASIAVFETVIRVKILSKLLFPTSNSRALKFASEPVALP